MAAAVRDFKDIPMLFVDEGEEKVTGQRKTTPEILDKIIQFVWDYKRQNNDATPPASVVERHIDGMKAGSIYYFMTLLVDEGRLNKISSKPFRVSITDHRKNKNAIERFKRLLAKKEEFEERERERIRAEQQEVRETERLETDKQALFASMPQAQPEEIVQPAPQSEVMVRERPAPRMSPDAKSVQDFTDAQARVREVNREVKAMMPKLLKIADERDLVYELVSRGYTVSRQR